jgi:6-phosphogluconolactonase
VNSTAEIAVHPNGRFVYGSNRGHDSLAIFAIGEDSRLSLVGHELTRGRTPRNFTIDPTGRWLLAGNQESNTITVFAIDPATGRLKLTGAAVPAGAPVSILFVP